MENANFKTDQERLRKEQIEQNKKLKTCSNCLHKSTCAMVHGVLSLPVNKFVLTLLQIPFYEGINKAMAENCFHFENENKGFYPKKEETKDPTSLLYVGCSHENNGTLLPEEEIKKGDFVKVIATEKELNSINIYGNQIADLLGSDKIPVQEYLKDKHNYFFSNGSYIRGDAVVLNHCAIPVSFVKKIKL